MTKKNETSDIVDISIDQIILPDVLERSEETDGDAIRQLAHSIGRIGLIEPIVVVPDGSKYRLAAGWRRYWAHRMMKRLRIPAVVREYTREEFLMVRWGENEDREQVHVVDQARFLLEMLKETKLSQHELSQKIGKSEAWISQRLALLETEPEIVKALLFDQINFAQARELILFPDREAILQYLQYVIEGGATAATIRSWRSGAEQACADAERHMGTPEATRVNDEGERIEEFLCEACRTIKPYSEIRMMRCCGTCYRDLVAAVKQAEGGGR